MAALDAAPLKVNIRIQNFFQRTLYRFQRLPSIDDSIALRLTARPLQIRGAYAFEERRLFDSVTVMPIPKP